MEENQKNMAILRIEQILQTKDPVYLKAREIFKEVIEPIVEVETENWKKLAYSIPE